MVALNGIRTNIAISTRGTDRICHVGGATFAGLVTLRETSIVPILRCASPRTQRSLTFLCLRRGREVLSLLASITHRIN